MCWLNKAVALTQRIGDTPHQDPAAEAALHHAACVRAVGMAELVPIAALTAAAPGQGEAFTDQSQNQKNWAAALEVAEAFEVEVRSKSKSAEASF